MGAHKYNLKALLVVLVATFGITTTTAIAQVPGDFNGDGWVGGTDRSQILSCPLQPIPTSPTCDPMDTDGDGDVDVDDLLGLFEIAALSGACDVPRNGRIFSGSVGAVARFGGFLPGFSGASCTIRLGRFPSLCSEPFATSGVPSNAFVSLLEDTSQQEFVRHVQIGFSRARGFQGLPAAPAAFNTIYTEFKGLPVTASPTNTTWYDRQFFDFSSIYTVQDTVEYRVQRAPATTFLQGRFRYFVDGLLIRTYEDSSMDNIELRRANYQIETKSVSTRCIGSIFSPGQFRNCAVGLGDPPLYSDADLLGFPRFLGSPSIFGTTLVQSGGEFGNGFDVWDKR